MSGITTVTAALYPKPPVKQPEKTALQSARASSSRQPSDKLASSIMADGGLRFLRSRLEEKLDTMFAVVEENGGIPDGMTATSFYDMDVDVSPQATAERIVGFALSMMGTYSRQNKGMDEQELLVGFEEEIRKGISDGFSHARSVLGGLDLLEGDIENNVSSTWDWVNKLLDDHFRPEE